MFFFCWKFLESLGKEISWIDKRTIKIKEKTPPDLNKIREDLIAKFRGSVLLFGPLLARCGELKFPQPGGCLIGARPISTHLDAFSQLGAKVEVRGFRKRRIFLLKGW